VERPGTKRECYRKQSCYKCNPGMLLKENELNAEIGGSNWRLEGAQSPYPCFVTLRASPTGAPPRRT
jgi:hypothetical protein